MYIRKHFKTLMTNKIVIWLILLIIILSAASSIINIHKKANISEKAKLQLAYVKAFYSEIETIEWQVISEQKVPSHLEQSFKNRTLRLQNQLNALTKLDGNNENIKKINQLSQDYVALVTKEIAFVKVGKISEAKALDEQSVDPQALILELLIDRLIKEFDNNARYLNALVRFEVLLTAVIAALLIGILFWHINSITRNSAIMKAEQSVLLESEMRFRSLIQNSSDVIIILDAGGNISYVSSSCENVLGKTPEEFTSKNILEHCYTADDKLNLKAFLNSCISHPKQNHSLELQNFLDNNNKYFNLIGQNMLGDPNISGIVINLRDITNRKFFEQEIHQQEKFLTNIFTSIQDGLMVTDKEYTILRVNPTMEAMFANQFPMVGKKCHQVFHQIDTPCKDCYCKDTLSNGQPTYRVLNINNLEEDIGMFEHFSFPLVETSTKQINGLIHYSRNITERYQMQREMARFESLNMIGEIAASIAHEIRNPMTTVRGFLQLFGSKKTTLDPEYINIMIDELDRANSIITEFLSLAKNRALEIKAISLNSVIKNLYPLIRADALRKEIVLTLDLKDIPHLNMDEKEIRQLILNLVRNGMESMEEKGALAISTFVDASEVVLSVADQGSGIEPQILDKLGTPFLTTKEKGTGLGLAVCYSIASKHNAQIEVKSSSQGTTFLIRFKTV